MNTRFLYILFFSFSWLMPAKAQYDTESVERSRMFNAKVKTKTEWTHDYVNGKPAAKGFKSSVTEYDRRGNTTKIVNYDESGAIISTYIYLYDSRDNRVNHERFKGNREKLQYSQKTLYDSRGNKTREYGCDGTNPYNNIYVYDAGGRLVEITYSTAASSCSDPQPNYAVTEKRQLSYSGNKTQISVFDSKNSLLFEQVNTHNDKGLLISEIRTGVQGNVQHSLNMQYNNVGNLTEEMKKRSDGKLDYQKTMQYDNNNRIVKVETTNLDGSKFVSDEYQYNSMGDLMLYSWKKNERASESSTKKYVYDNKGLYTQVDSYFATYKLSSLYKYVYEFY